MALTRDFRETIVDRIQNDPEFAVKQHQSTQDRLADGDCNATMISSSLSLRRLTIELNVDPIQPRKLRQA